MARSRVLFRDHSDLVLFVLSGLLLLIASVLFRTLPSQLSIGDYQIAVLSFLVALWVTAIGNVVVGFIQRSVTRETTRALEEPISDIETALAGPIKELNDAVDKLRQIQVFYDLGVVGVFSNRSAAMTPFLERIKHEERTIEFVGTSLLGSLDPGDENEDKHQLQELLIKKHQSGVRIRVLLMHPAYGEFRERVETRGRASVASDIQGTLRYLLSQDVDATKAASGTKGGKFLQYSDVKLYPGVVTAYAIFTSHSMLVNLSTLCGSVYDNCALIVEDRPDPNSIFKKFKETHFALPWRSKKTVQVNEELLKKLLELDFAGKDYRFKEGKWPATILSEDGSSVQSNPEEHQPKPESVNGQSASQATQPAVASPKT
jgi:hypothetical protein